MAYSASGVGRFRLNIYSYRSQVGIAVRFIPFEIRSLESLGLPLVVRQLALLPRGLVLVTGATGSGKSTTLAAMLNECNLMRSGHIVTVEDPVEYLIRDKKSIITQREVGLDTESFASGLKSALRQDPDVIMIGELRDKDTIQTALVAAETGHLVVSTLHTKDALETVNRIIGVFPPEAQREVRLQFSASLAGIVSMRLLPTIPGEDGKSRGRIPAIEILINTARIRDCLIDPGKTLQIREAIEQGSEMYGMQTFDQHLMLHLKEGRISKETAIANASNPSDFELRLKGIRSSDDAKWGKSQKAPEPRDQELSALTGGVLELDTLFRNSPPKKKS